MKVVVCVARMLAYTPMETISFEQAEEAFYVKGAKHRLMQSNGESVVDLMSRHRSALVELRRRLQRLGKMHKAPDSNDLGLNLLKSTTLDITDVVMDKQRRERVLPKDVTMQGAMK